jgi:hypothetical protein
MLAQKEAKITKDWLEMKGVSTTGTLDMDRISQEVSSLCKRWYGFELDQAIATSAVTTPQAVGFVGKISASAEAASGKGGGIN